TRLRGQVHDARIPALLQVRHRQPNAVELPRDVDSEAAVPVLGVDLLDAARRPCDAGVVDEAVEAAELFQRLVEHGGDLPAVGDIADAPRQLRIGFCQSL